MASRLQSIALTLVLLLVINTSAGAWGDTGHMVVAQIAFNNLDSQRRVRVTQLAQKVQLANRTYDFVTVACWMDDARDFPMFEPLRDWHFIDKRFIVSGPAQDLPPPPVNVQSILEWAIDKLGDPTAKENAKAYALAYLVHLAGDVHQPLHCASRFTADHPDGDHGGNFFLLKNAPRPNLHSYWDAAGGLFNFTDVEHPLNSAGKQRVKQFASNITSLNPESAFPNVADLQPADWVSESHGFARTDSYQDISENGTPSTQYRDHTQAVCRKRLALAGYRLARVIEKVLH